MARLFRTPRGFDVAIKHIRAVNSVALYGSFTAAAADLGITQSAVSRLVLQLEKQLGVSLFLRSTRNVVLTAPGREFTASTRRFIEDLNIQVENARALGGQIRGRLIISCLLSITHHVVPDAVLKYRKAHPGVEVHLLEGLGSAVHEDVRSGLADFGVGNMTGLSQEVVADEIAREACFAILPSKHRLRNRKSITLKDLEDEEFVSLPTGAGIALKHMTVVGQFGTLFDFVAADVGVAIVPASALPRRRQYDVVVKRLVAPSIVRSVGILRLKNRALTPAASGFLDIFRPLFLSASRR
jgi:LysR family transcriptional regulator, carnitine catabolism transcriptional activator